MRPPAGTAKAFDMPIGRSSMNAFEDEAFRETVAATGRSRLIVGVRSQTAQAEKLAAADQKEG